MEAELQRLVDSNGRLPALEKNRYLASKRVIRIDSLSRMTAVIQASDGSFPYVEMSKKVDDVVRGIKHTKAGSMKTIDTSEIDKQVKVDNEIMQQYEEINPDEIDF